MAPDCLIDSNVYIDLLRTGRDTVARLEHWVSETGTQIVICGVVRLEVLRGVKDPGVYRKLSAFMDVMVNVPSTNRLWDAATKLAWTLDRKGMVIPGTDVVIAASALAIGAAVMTSDANFSSLEGLRVIAPPAEWFE